MQVMDGASFPTSPDHWRKAEVIVGDADFAQLMVEWDVDSATVSISQKYLILSNLAQRLLTHRIYELGGLSAEEAQVLNTRINDERRKLRVKLQGQPAGSAAS